MARTRDELAAAFDRILNSTGQQVDSVEKANQLRVAFSRNLATEVDTYVQYQITASFVEINTKIDNLTALVNQLRTNLTGSSV
jgi:hypothetical protein